LYATAEVDLKGCWIDYDSSVFEEIGDGLPNERLKFAHGFLLVPLDAKVVWTDGRSLRALNFNVRQLRVQTIERGGGSE
jgi:hypothetical protein